MKTFRSLKFKKHGLTGLTGLTSHAELFFPNGYGISVITGEYAYSGADEPYEIAVLKGNKKEAKITYRTPITDDVIGHLTEEEVTKIMKDIQDLSL